MPSKALTSSRQSASLLRFPSNGCTFRYSHLLPYYSTSLLAALPHNHCVRFINRGYIMGNVTSQQYPPISLNEFRDQCSGFCQWMIRVLADRYGVSVGIPTVMCYDAAIEVGSQVPIVTSYVWHLTDDGPAVSIYFGRCANNAWWYRVELVNGKYQGISLEGIKHSILGACSQAPAQVNVPN